jgi:hypothetical protein
VEGESTVTAIEAALDGYPPAPIDAWEPADWHEVPKGYYAIPVWDWHKFMNDCGPDEETPDLDLIGFQFVQRTVSRTYKTGRKAGQKYGKDELKIGRWYVAPGTTYYVIRAGLPDEQRWSPWDRMRRELEDYRHGATHDLLTEPPAGRIWCRCCDSCCWAAQHADTMAYVRKDNALTAYQDCIAAAIIDSIKTHDNLLSRLYGMITGSCGCCHATLTDPKSKLIGIGPDCRGYR